MEYAITLQRLFCIFSINVIRTVKTRIKVKTENCISFFCKTDPSDINYIYIGLINTLLTNILTNSEAAERQNQMSDTDVSVQAALANEQTKFFA